MTDDSPLLGDEIENHKTNLNGYVTDIEKLSVSESRKGVHQRFVRDCKTLITDLDQADSPSSSDLCDFDDRANSLEIMYHQLTDSTQ